LLASEEAGQQRLKTLSSSVPLCRLGTPDEIAKGVVFLASDDSSYITGTELFVDGGFAQV
jgi:NAD(P)-dependent dehydrogenase (short-subunit alcohol dehydrogenase family)